MGKAKTSDTVFCAGGAAANVALFEATTAVARRSGHAAVHYPHLGRTCQVPFIESLTAKIRNRNRRMAHAHAVKKSFDWYDQRQLDLGEVEPVSVGAYI